METGKSVKQQLELDFSARKDDIKSGDFSELAANVISIFQSRQSLAKQKSPSGLDVAKEDALRSTIDSLLARYK